MPLNDQDTEAARFFDLICGDERGDRLLEIRTRRPAEDGMRRWFVRIDARARLAPRIRSLAACADVYVGCAPRQVAKGTRDAVSHAWVAWADVDGPDGQERVAALRPQPTLVVASGSPGGVHAYWRLDRAMPVDDVEELNRRLAHAAGGDPVWAATTILRPPGTANHKHHPAAEVHAIGGAGETYDPDRLLEQLAPVPHAPSRATPRTRTRGADPLLDITPADYVRRLTGLVPSRAGYVSCPLHADERPSLKVYETPDRGWYCYSARCRRGGTIYDFAAALWGVDTRGDGFRLLRSRLLETFPEAR